MKTIGENRERRAATFNEIAELYDVGRRECPEHLFEDLFANVPVDAATADILEIGCGTGQATLPLARRGCRVLAVEMGANLVRIAQRKLAAFPKVEIVNARFEDWKPVRRFDMVLAVTSWHWIDPKVRYARAAAALKPGGTLAFTVSEHAFPAGFDPFFREIQDCYAEIGVGRLKFPRPLPEEVPDVSSEIELSGYFENIRVVRRLWTQEFTADEHVALMNTASDHRLLEPEKRERLFAEMRRLIGMRPDGRITKHNLTMLHLARAKA
ncbi:MAG TPA: class I SAM-dependent methyltransferase [Terracidiphilus sp.]|nr:class I SAM-dependent methyltransferase [Terracidiphilus sp.]